jgi:hypothetical protein
MESNRSAPIPARRRSALTRRILELVLAAALFSVPRIALAQETKNYPGFFCTPKSADLMANYSSWQGHLNSHHLRPGDTDVVFCPIIKTVPNDGRLNSVAVRITQNVSNEIKCKLQRFRADVQLSGDVAPVETPFKTKSGTGNQTIDFTDTFGTQTEVPTNGNDWRYYQIACVVPSGASIRSYRVTEAGARDQLFKTYPPTMCRLNEADSLARWTTEGSFINARERENDAQPSDKVRMVCPIIADKVTNTAGTATAHVYVGRPTAGNGPVSCTMFAGNDGVISDTFTAPDVGDQGTGGSEWDAELVNLDLNSSPAWGRFMFQCTMPGNGDGKLFGYRVVEPGTISETRDAKVYPGTLCWAANGLNDLLFHHWKGLAVNNAGNWMETWCPIITDKDSNATGLNVLRIKINESVPGFANGGTSCDVHAYTNTGTFLTSAGGTVSGTGERIISLPLTHSGANAIYTVQCFLSVGSWLNEYEVEER